MISAEPGNYAWTGQSVEFKIRPFKIRTEGGVYSWTGFDATFPGFEGQPAGAPRKYILPDNRVYTDPRRALFELNRYLERRAKSQISQDLSEPQELPIIDVLPEPEEIELREPLMLTPAQIQRMEMQLQSMPDLRLDPELLDLLVRQIDDDEAAMLLI